MNKELEDLKIELMLNGKAQYFYNIEDFFVHMFIPQKNGEGYQMYLDEKEWKEGRKKVLREIKKL